MSVYTFIPTSAGPLPLSKIAGGGAWTPASATGLKGWWKASAGVSQSGGFVTSLADQSGVGNNLSPHANNIAPGATSFNSAYPGLTMNRDTGTGADWLAKTSMALNSTTCSFFATFAPLTSHSANGGRLVSVKAVGQTNDYDNNASFDIALDNAAGKLYSYCNNAYVGTSGGQVVSDAAPITAGLVFDGSNVKFYIGGTQVGSSSAWTTAIGGASGVDFVLMNSPFSDVMSMVFAEAFIASSAVLASDYQTYAASTWGV